MDTLWLLTLLTMSSPPSRGLPAPNGSLIAPGKSYAHLFQIPLARNTQETKRRKRAADFTRGPINGFPTTASMALTTYTAYTSDDGFTQTTDCVNDTTTTIAVDNSSPVAARGGPNLTNPDRNATTTTERTPVTTEEHVNWRGWAKSKGVMVVNSTLEWPFGNYYLPVPTRRCPGTGGLTKSRPANVPISAFLPRDIILCAHHLPKVVLPRSGISLWQPGQYCIFLRKSATRMAQAEPCPPMLDRERVRIFRKQTSPLTLEFCCMKANVTLGISPLILPTGSPFYLIASAGATCTEVKGMVLRRVEKTVDISRHGVTGVQLAEDGPDFKWSQTAGTFTISFCDYGPQRDAASRLKGRNRPPEDEDTILDVAIAVPVVVAVFVIVGVVVVVWRRKRNKRQPELFDISVIDTTLSSSQCPTAGPNTKQLKPLEVGSVLKTILDAETQLTIYRLLLHPENLEVFDKIGNGAFGTVYYGRYRPDDNPLNCKEVAVKTLKDNCCYADINGFINEAMVMADFCHPNVLSLTGVCIKEETEVPIIVLPYMAHGDLQNYLRHFRYDQELKDKTPDFPQLMSFCLHVARGMSYLTDMKFVHRDLAARNCMLDADMVVKVADFGLTRDIYCSSYYRQDRNKLLPIKWMALESLQDRVFTTNSDIHKTNPNQPKPGRTFGDVRGRCVLAGNPVFTTNSDIWSYGVTVWEILTLGKVPYPDQENHEILNFLENGGRLQQPNGCSDELYALMQKCWDEDPKGRPPFKDIVSQLEGFLTCLCGYLDLSVDTGSQAPFSTRRPLRLTSTLSSETLQNTEPVRLQFRRNYYSDYRKTDPGLGPEEPVIPAE